MVETTAIFNLKEKQGYSKISSDGYLFCVSVENVQPYLDGYKVTFKVGNPLFATFQNPEVHLKWSRDLWEYCKEQRAKDKSKTFSYLLHMWEKSCKKANITILKELKPGTWNKFEVLLTPATLDEIERVEFSMEVNTASFYIDTSSI